MKGIITAALGAVYVLAITASAASAKIVCNREGECWHVKEHGWIKPEHGLIVHPDNWKWAARENFKWREHEGRGYWRGGVWVEIK